MKYVLFFILLCISLFLQITATLLPLSFMVLLVWSIESENITPLLLAFLSGIILDVSLLNDLGQSSLYFLIILLLVFLYERKFEVKSIQFVFFASFFSTFFNFLIFRSTFSLLESFFCSVLTVFLFIFSRVFFAPKKQTLSPLV